MSSLHQTDFYTGTYWIVPSSGLWWSIRQKVSDVIDFRRLETNDIFDVVDWKKVYSIHRDLDLRIGL